MSGSSIESDLARSAVTGQPVRLHLDDGEVAVVRILTADPAEITYDVLRSSRPERYAFCDATGYQRPRAEITRTKLMSEAELERFGKRRR